MTERDYDFIINSLDCDESGEDHRLGVRDGRIELLDHNEGMVTAFTAFGANEPDCVIMANMFRPAVKEFYKARDAWAKIVWSSYVRSDSIDPSGMTLKQMRKMERKAIDAKKVAARKKRLAAAQATMTKYGPRMFIDPEARKRYSEAADSIPYIERAISAASESNIPWQVAANDVEDWEGAATAAQALATATLEALISYKPHATFAILDDLEDVLQTLPIEPGDEGWDEFMHATREQALDLERYYEE
jgi:hypothetical protein